MQSSPIKTSKHTTALCLDLGGTSLKTALVRDGKILKKGNVRTDTTHGIEGIKETYRSAFDFAHAMDFDFVSVSSAGRIDSQTATCTYATDTLPGYTGFDIGGFLSIYFHRPIYAINDGYAAGLGEYHTTKGLGKMLMLTIGTGLGGVIIDSGKIINFPEDRDMGHLELFEGGIPCTCGRCGCMECYASGTALTKLLLPYESSAAQKRMRWMRYTAGESGIVYGVKTWLSSLRAAADRIYSLQPFDTLVLGGGVSDDGNNWFRGEIFEGAPYKASLASLGNDAGVLGAYYFGLNSHANGK